MRLKSLSDRELLARTQQLVQKERELLSEILQHLKEVERRKLYSDLGYSSLFDYCLRELKYSEAQAGRRLQALKLIRELPQVEEKIASGALNLTHICQAQSFFKHVQKAASKGVNKEQKLQVLHEIAHKSSRETQALLVAKTAQAGLAPQLPMERERMLSKEHSEVRLVLNQELRQRLEEVKSLLGPKALGMSLAELIGAMAELSLETLKDKKFGKRRAASDDARATTGGVTAGTRGGSMTAESSTAPAKLCVKSNYGVRARASSPHASTSPSTSPSKSGSAAKMHPMTRAKSESHGLQPSLNVLTKKPRSISKGEKWQIWQRDGGRCGQCGSQKNLQVDHCIPVGRGGTAELENLRLLCGNCNLREGIKSFGPARMRRSG